MSDDVYLSNTSLSYYSSCQELLEDADDNGRSLRCVDFASDFVDCFLAVVRGN